MKDCTKEELEAFVATYPRKLVRDVWGACEPPLITFNDFTLGNWPESVVAQYHDGYPEGSPPPFCGPATNHRIADVVPATDRKYVTENTHDYFTIGGRADYHRKIGGGWLLVLALDPNVLAEGATQEEARSAFELVLRDKFMAHDTERNT